MKFIELTVFKNDMNAVLEYLGKKAVIQFPETQGTAENSAVMHISEIIDRLQVVCEYIGIDFEKAYYSDVDNEKVFSAENSEHENLTNTICSVIENLKEKEIKTIQEKQRIHETINEAKAFSKMNVPFSDFEHLSYLTLRLGRLDPKSLPELREGLGDRAVIIELGHGNRVLAASSKKGRFALDTLLKKAAFQPIDIPENYCGVPAEMLASLNDQHNQLEQEYEKINSSKNFLRNEYKAEIRKLISSWRITLMIEGIKSHFTATENLYHFSGWTPADTEKQLVSDLSALTGSRVAVHSYMPEEIPSVQNGTDKVPVAMKHSAFVKGFEGVVFSYGAPLYGTIDPTPLVAFFFTLMFGIMFGDVGQGFVLFLAGLLIKNGPKSFAKFSKFSIPLISVGTASMIMGLLAGSVFAHEKLLVGPTRAITGALFGYPMDRILHILPMAGEGGSITKLLYFFGFTVAIGVVINSLGLIINIFNRFILKKYMHAFFSKTGLSGLLMFWYALFIAIRIILGGKFEMYDFAGLLIPAFCIFFGPVIWRIVTKEKHVLENGFFTFLLEGAMEVMDTVSSYFSNTVSFLRVGAFALAHAVFSFIVFYFTDELARSGLAGTFSAILIMIIGNAIIILLEGLIVAIQVIRLQYYEFFNKFFIETGVEFAPFKFNAKKI